MDLCACVSAGPQVVDFWGVIWAKHIHELMRPGRPFLCCRRRKLLGHLLAKPEQVLDIGYARLQDLSWVLLQLLVHRCDVVWGVALKSEW